MHSSLFFKLFPPPKFMVMKHAGLEISDDAIHCLEYSGHYPHLRITKYASMELPEGLVEGGEIKDNKALGDILVKLDKNQDLSYVKVSVPEEKSYLFQTEISSTNPVAIAQNVEFKLEENVPLSIAEAVFYFDVLPMSVTGGKLKASVSVVPQSYIENVISILKPAGLLPIAFEVVPKSIAKAVISSSQGNTVMVVHIMNKKTGVYIVCGGVVCFTSTVAWGSRGTKVAEDNQIKTLLNEIIRINSYWSSHNEGTSQLERVVLVGHGADQFETAISEAVASAGLVVEIGNVWSNAFSVDSYIPPIFKEDSLDYAVVAGSAMDL